ncbi:hypothetical protein PMPD1_3524 [Paramixta manurensis]|uniref:Uncharacterized protein n=1 Tax=Paramixta manurensis TaxID=2740817 RepID=A0A6M8UHS3_9GAMM|nr:hypothetical protein PMPD1_3524 [Erwiniaceae bacterium PD-1]
MRNLRMIEHYYRRVRRVAACRTGSVTIEAALVFTVLITLCMALVEYGFFLAFKGRTEAVSHSLVSVIRERSALYNGVDPLSRMDVEQLTQLAKTMLADNAAQTFCLTVEMVSFSTGEQKQVENYSLFSGGMAGCQLSPVKPLDTLVALSPWTSRARWLPLYQVTLSVPVPKGSLNRLLQGARILPERVVVSAVAVRR